MRSASEWPALAAAQRTGPKLQPRPPLQNPTPHPLAACRDPQGCDKNYIKWYQTQEGWGCELVLAHFKNDTIKGTQHLPLSHKLRGALVYLERAHAYLGIDCPSLWFSNRGEVYKKDYWSTVCSRALTLHDGRRITACSYRHLFATAWRDYINCPSTKLGEMSMHELDAAAADLMCSSTNAFTAAYDDTNRVRGTRIIMAHWQDFTQFVRREFELKQSEK